MSRGLSFQICCPVDICLEASVNQSKIKLASFASLQGTLDVPGEDAQTWLHQHFGQDGDGALAVPDVVDAGRLARERTPDPRGTIRESWGSTEADYCPLIRFPQTKGKFQNFKNSYTQSPY